MVGKWVVNRTGKTEPITPKLYDLQLFMRVGGESHHRHFQSAIQHPQVSLLRIQKVQVEFDFRMALGVPL